MLIRFFLTFFFSCVFLSLQAQTEYVHQPSVSPDGLNISFSYQGDIWTASVEGGIARRLTVHPSYETFPQWSPDGTSIAFQAERWSNADIYVMDADGGMPKQLTYHSTNDAYPQWYDNEHITFMTRRNYLQLERDYEVHMAPVQGGTPRRYMDALGGHACASGDGNLIAFEKQTCRITREAYTGPANRDIWVYNRSSDSYHAITEENAQETYPKWANGDLYYLSAQNGRYNLYRQNINEDGSSNGTGKAITSYTDEGITHYDVSTDGSVVVFEKGGWIYRISNGGEPEKVELMLSKDMHGDPITYNKINNGVSGYDVSPNEKLMALSIKGDLFVKRYDKDQKRLVQVTDHPFRDKEPHWLNDNTLIFSSDRNGSFDLYALTSADGQKDIYSSLKHSVRRLTHGPEEDEALSISPDKKKIIFRRGRGKLIVAQITPNGQILNEVALLDGWSIPADVSWSPDSRWIAYSLSDINFNREVYIQPASGGEAVNISMHPRSDKDPIWSADGKKLGFISNRNNGDDDIWFAWLEKEAWQMTKRDWEEDEYQKEEPDEKAKVIVNIDFEDIYERLEQVSSLPGNEQNIVLSKDGDTFYFTTNGGSRQGQSGKRQLMSAKWDGSELEVVLKDGQLSRLSLDKKGKSIIALSKSVPAVIDLKSKKLTKHPFSGSMNIIKAKEREQIFEEGWRRLRDGFYDPEFHGQDWDKLKMEYKNRCLNASTKEDFQNYFNQMLGQLNASHMGIRGGITDETQRISSGLLGIEIKPLEKGVKVEKVIPNTPADRKSSRLVMGDVITAINGIEITDNVNFYQYLNNTANEEVVLTVRNTSGVNREVRIRPTTSIRTELYESWVKERKSLVNQYSNGRLGYIHIRGMNWSSFERFERELTASGLGKDGLVIDVRYNGGGWTTDMLMTVLSVKQHSFTIPRGAALSLEDEKDKFVNTYPFGERLPFSAVTVPSIALCNENSYSNAEIFSHAFKALGLGTLVGMPTFGAVISTGSSRLMDGSYVRMPFRGWYVKNSMMNMEHGPAVPDIIVEDPPGSKGKGDDPQLARAVDELILQIGQK